MMVDKRSVEHSIVVHNVPAGIELGIDYNTWYVGPKFRGIKSIPNGFHFIFTSMVDKEQQHSPRNGQFLFLNGTQGCAIHQSSWDERNQELLAPFKQYPLEYLSENEAACLAPYPLNDQCQTWKKLTSYVTKTTVCRLAPLCHRISPSTQVDCTAELEKKEKQKLGIKDESNSHFESMKIRFTAVLEKKFPDGASPSDITKYSIDSSFALENVLQSVDSTNAEEELLGEIQFAFVCFMIGQVFDAFEHWKTIIRLVCKCDEALSKRSTFFAKFFDVIELQIKEIPEDFFVDIVAEQNFLVQTLRILFATLKDSNNIDRRLLAKGMHLKEFLMKRFDWDFDNQDEEDLPVIVSET